MSQNFFSSKVSFHSLKADRNKIFHDGTPTYRWVASEVNKVTALNMSATQQYSLQEHVFSKCTHVAVDSAPYPRYTYMDINSIESRWAELKSIWLNRKVIAFRHRVLK